jgi:hypothetical protein
MIDSKVETATKMAVPKTIPDKIDCGVVNEHAIHVRNESKARLFGL